MKGKLKFIVPLVLLLVLGGVYKFVLAKPAAEAKPKVAGEVYVLPKDFLINLTNGKFANIGIACATVWNQRTFLVDCRVLAANARWWHQFRILGTAGNPSFILMTEV